MDRFIVNALRTAFAFAVLFLASCRHDEPAKVAVTGISLDQTSLELIIGESATLTATVAPDDAYNKTVNWSSADDATATVDATGKVTAVAEGETSIIAATEDGGKTAICKVKVFSRFSPVSSISVEKEEYSILVMETVQIVAKVEPDNAANKELEYATMDKNIATVDDDGLVTGWNEGTTTILIRSKENFNITKKVTIVVSPDYSLKGIGLNPLEMDLEIGKSLTLSVIYTPSTAKDREVTWSSSNEAVAVVDVTGKVTGVGLGTADIKAVSSDGGFEAVCHVTVVKKSGVDVYAFMSRKGVEAYYVYVNGEVNSRITYTRYGFAMDSGHYYYSSGDKLHHRSPGGSEYETVEGYDFYSIHDILAKDGVCYVLNYALRPQRHVELCCIGLGKTIEFISESGYRNLDTASGRGQALAMGKDGRLYALILSENAFYEYWGSYLVIDPVKETVEEVLFDKLRSMGNSIQVSDDSDVYILSGYSSINGYLYSIFKNGEIMDAYKDVSGDARFTVCGNDVYIAHVDSGNGCIDIIKNFTQTLYSIEMESPTLYSIAAASNGDTYVAASNKDASVNGVFKNGTLVWQAQDSNYYFSKIIVDE